MQATSLAAEAQMVFDSLLSSPLWRGPILEGRFSGPREIFWREMRRWARRWAHGMAAGLGGRVYLLLTWRSSPAMGAAVFIDAGGPRLAYLDFHGFSYVKVDGRMGVVPGEVTAFYGVLDEPYYRRVDVLLPVIRRTMVARGYWLTASRGQDGGEILGCHSSVAVFERRKAKFVIVHPWIRFIFPVIRIAWAWHHRVIPVDAEVLGEAMEVCPQPGESLAALG